MGHSRSDLVKKAAVVANAKAMDGVLQKFKGGELLASQVITEIKPFFKTVRDQLKQTEEVHWAAEQKDPQDEALADLAGQQEGILEKMDEDLRAAIGELQKSQPNKDEAIKKLSEAVAKAEAYMDDLK